MNFDTVLTTDRTGWVGSDGLWTQLPAGGVLATVWDPESHLMRAKMGWFRAIPGDVSITAESLDLPSARFQGDVGTAREYGPTGFTASALEFSSAGCWRITGILGPARLSLILEVAAPNS
jgi:hypothetical protein